MRPRIEPSLRLRLTLLFVGFMLLLDIALGAIIYFDTRAFLHETTASRLRALARPAIENWRAADPTESEPPDLVSAAPALSRTLTFRETTGVVVDRQGTPLADGRDVPQELAPAAIDRAALERALAGDNEVSYVAEVDGRRMLAALVPLRPFPGAAEVVGVAQLSTPLDLVDAILWRQRLLIAFCALLAVVLGTAGGLWITGATLAPLRRMVETCRRIAGGDFGERSALPHRGDEVGHLATAFDDMVAHIEAAFAAQRRFVADAAHELRTPVTALSGSVDVLAHGAQDDPTAAATLIQGMRGEVDRLRRLTEQLLDLSALERPIGRVEPIPLEPGAFLERLAQEARPLVGDRALRLEPGPPVRFLADPESLKRAMFNLFDNAAQHTAPGETIRLGWTAAGKVLELWVADDGEGILPADLPHVFEPFYRGDRSRSRRRGGTGLGLALTKAIAEAHGGSVRAESEAGRGTRITLAFPVASEDDGLALGTRGGVGQGSAAGGTDGSG